ncbi:hypothetical protein ACFFRR_009469 [Megaselia abdita]
MDVRQRGSKPNPRGSIEPFLDKKQKRPGQDHYLLKFVYSKQKLHWYWVPAFITFWLLLYSLVSIRAYHTLPRPLTLKDELKHSDKFIAERAQQNLVKLTSFGPRVVGSDANEKKTIEFLFNAVSEVKSQMDKSVWDIEVDTQIASGSYIHWEMVNMYQSIQNFVVKLSPKNTNSTSYLLLNSHSDSVPGGVGAGDDGAMVVIMLEAMRVIAKSNKPTRHPIVFLFNGAEENPLQASHAFITQHKWAKNCKALINLDSAGSGGREILFQSGPGHPWLMKYYKQAAPHPFASTVAEEMFQRHVIPSDTDFRIFRDHGPVPGLDMAHQYNGYVYHTKYDVVDIIPNGTYQSTGDNVLSLAKAIANAPELDDTSKHAEGHTVYYDYMGSFLVFYSETEGIIINVLVSLAALICIGISYATMSKVTGYPLLKIINKSITLFGIQILSTLLAIFLTFAVAIFMDWVRLPMSWFTHSWLILGLYFCPMIFGLGILPASYLEKSKYERLPLSFKVQLLLHSHCIYLAVLTIILTSIGIRSAFVLMICILFYTFSLIINLATQLHNKPLLWIIPVALCQIFPFVFLAYLSHGFFVAIIPMTGRFGAAVNPDLIVCAFTVLVATLTTGFLVPLLNMFRKTKTTLWSFLAWTVIFIIIAATPLGFPYRAETNVQRFNILNTQRTFYNFDNTIRKQDSGYYILPQDRRTYSVDKYISRAEKSRSLNHDCETEVFCGLPLYNHRWHAARESSFWIPGPSVKLNNHPKIEIKKVTEMKKTDVVRYDFKLTGPDHMTIFINPINATVVSWSFHDTPLRMQWKPPYFIYFSYGIDSTPLSFYIDFKREGKAKTKPFVELGISAHFNHEQTQSPQTFNSLIDTFPDWADVTHWMSSYDSYVF